MNNRRVRGVSAYIEGQASSISAANLYGHSTGGTFESDTSVGSKLFDPLLNSGAVLGRTAPFLRYVTCDRVSP
jgi:hypothetical protein